MLRLSDHDHLDAGAELFVRVVNPHTGASGFLPILPATLPSSPTRFYRGVPPASVCGVPLHGSPAAGDSSTGEKRRLPEVPAACAPTAGSPVLRRRRLPSGASFSTRSP